MPSDSSAAARPGTLLCLGLGYSAEALTARLLQRGWRVLGTTRSAERAAALEARVIEILQLGEEGFAAPELAAALSQATHLLSSAPPDQEGDPALRGLGPALETARQLAWIGYLSTTGVYGDRGGAWVDEETPPAPGNDRSRRRLAAETVWLNLCLDRGLPVHIFRLSGIYGPGRSQIDALRAGRARRIVKPGQVFSRIHVEDIATALEASMARPAPGRIYNLADDEPAPASDVVTYGAGLLGIDPPPEEPYEDTGLSEMAQSFYAECRRVRNLRLRRELGVDLAYPTYREGLAAQLAAG